MSKKIINVKYHQSAIATMSESDLESITSEIKDIIGDDYTVIFTPFDFQEIPDEGLFGTVEGILNSLKADGRDNDIIKLAELVAKFVPAEYGSEELVEPKYHQCDCVSGSECNCKR